MRRLILRNFQSPGDLLMLTAAVRDLHRTYPGQFQTDVRTPCPGLWENNPYLTPLDENDPGVRTVDCHYPLIHESNQSPYHFIHGFRLYLNEVLELNIKAGPFKGDIHLREEEIHWLSQVDEITGRAGSRFWIIVSGGKTDFTAKWWDPRRCQAVVDHFLGRIQFVQVGELSDGHVHPRLENVFDLRGKTDLRQLIRLTYHADGVVCPVTMLMHLAAAVPTKPGRPRNRPCVVTAGGREPAQWEAYPHHQYLHANGCLPCCDDGGCWKSRVRPLGDGDSKDNDLCVLPVQLPGGRWLPRCLDLIAARHVIEAVERYLQYEPARPGRDNAAAAEADLARKL
jgi:ADP-heptose:LPS heptosyltransferase